VARGAARANSDVDLWVVGRCDYAALLRACAVAGERLGRPVSPVLYAPAELAALKAQPDNAFLAEVRRQPRLALIGSLDDIARALGEPGEDR
jgi:predicted nucleotidyltransferase